MGYQKYKRMTHKFLWDASGANGCDSSTLTGTIPVFTTGAKCLVHSVKASVLTLVAGSTAEIVGDGDDDNGFLEDGFAAATGVYPLYSGDPSATFAGAYSYDKNAGATDALDVDTQPKAKYYAASDTIDFKISGTASAGKIVFLIDFEIVG